MVEAVTVTLVVLGVVLVTALVSYIVSMSYVQFNLLPDVDRVTMRYGMGGEPGERVLVPSGDHCGIYDASTWTPSGDVIVEGSVTHHNGRKYTFRGSQWTTHDIPLNNDGEYDTVIRGHKHAVSVVDGNVRAKQKGVVDAIMQGTAKLFEIKY
ncbi:MAG: hypothetical protein CMK92_02220 [Pseudomonas sp.]|nr:hypothetical protein [Pseudomonas sp.]|tara:strand:- start:845 stop:1303 length:459 start_codon:yes stop_codon:yes gene_type:complete